MLLSAYVLFDVAADVYTRPIFFANEDVLIRTLRQMLREGDETAAKFPEEFQVFYVGTYDDQTGVIDAIPPKWLLNLHTLKDSNNG